MGRKRETTTLELLDLNKPHFVDKTEAESQHAAVQDQIAKMEPEKRNAILTMQQEVDASLGIENDLHFSDAAFESDARLKKARDLEQRAVVGKLFVNDGNILIKTPFNKVIPGQVYVDVLQDNILGVTDKLNQLEQHVVELNDQLNLVDHIDDYTFFGLIKLAFKRLFRKRD